MTADPSTSTPLTDEERDTVERNLGLAHAFALATNMTRLPMDDRVQAAVRGLMRAVQKHDPSKSKLSTYASQHMRAAVRNAGHLDAVVLVHESVRRLKPDTPKHADKIAKAERTKEIVRAGDVEPDGFAVWSNPAARMEAEDDAAKLKRCLSRLPDPQREVIESIYWDGENRSQIARREGRNKGTIHLRERKALAMLREMMDDDEQPSQARRNGR